LWVLIPRRNNKVSEPSTWSKNDFLAQYHSTRDCWLHPSGFFYFAM